MSNPTMERHDKREERRAFWAVVGRFALLLTLLCAAFVLPFMSWPHG